MCQCWKFGITSCHHAQRFRRPRLLQSPHRCSIHHVLEYLENHLEKWKNYVPNKHKQTAFMPHTCSWPFSELKSSAFFSKDWTQTFLFCRHLEAAALFRSRNFLLFSSGSSLAALLRRPLVFWVCGVVWAGEACDNIDRSLWHHCVGSKLTQARHGIKGRAANFMPWNLMIIISTLEQHENHSVAEFLLNNKLCDSKKLNVMYGERLP